MTFENVCLIVVSLWCKANGTSPPHEWALYTQTHSQTDIYTIDTPLAI